MINEKNKKSILIYYSCKYADILDVINPFKF